MPALPATATRCTPEACSSWGSDARACRAQIILLTHGPVGQGWAGECRQLLRGHLADWPTAGCWQEGTLWSQACMTRRKCWSFCCRLPWQRGGSGPGDTICGPQACSSFRRPRSRSCSDAREQKWLQPNSQQLQQFKHLESL